MRFWLKRLRRFSRKAASLVYASNSTKSCTPTLSLAVSAPSMCRRMCLLLTSSFWKKQNILNEPQQLIYSAVSIVVSWENGAPSPAAGGEPGDLTRSSLTACTRGCAKSRNATSSSCKSWAFPVPGTPLNTWRVFSPLILIRNLCSKCCYHAHPTDEETEGGEVIKCAQDLQKAEPGYEPGEPGPEPAFLTIKCIIFSKWQSSKKGMSFYRKVFKEGQSRRVPSPKLGFGPPWRRCSCSLLDGRASHWARAGPRSPGIRTTLLGTGSKAGGAGDLVLQRLSGTVTGKGSPGPRDWQCTVGGDLACVMSVLGQLRQGDQGSNQGCGVTEGPGALGTQFMHVPSAYHCAAEKQESKPGRETACYCCVPPVPSMDKGEHRAHFKENNWFSKCQYYRESSDRRAHKLTAGTHGHAKVLEQLRWPWKRKSKARGLTLPCSK